MYSYKQNDPLCGRKGGAMEYNRPIADMLPGMDVEGFYILRAAALKTTNSGKPFLSGTICDRTGSRSGTTAAPSARARMIPAAS